MTEGCNLTPNNLDAQRATLGSVPQSPAQSTSVDGAHKDYKPLPNSSGGNVK